MDDGRTVNRDMYSESDLLTEVAALVEAAIEANQSLNPNWLTHEVISKHLSIEGSDKPFYILCAYEHVRSALRGVLRRYKGDPTAEVADRQITLPGFKHIQKAYLVNRDGEQMLVPTPLLTVAELAAKAEEYNRMSAGCAAHADELLRYIKERGSDAAAA